MELTDRDLWHILQAKPTAKRKSRPWERDEGTGVARAWIDWAKAEILSGGATVTKRGVDHAEGIAYLARLIRMLDVLREQGMVSGVSRDSEIGTMYEESFVSTLLVNGLEACGSSRQEVEDVLWMATRDGYLIKREVDDWKPGMASGTGRRAYLALTFKGRKRAEAATVMPALSDEGSGGLREGADGEPPDAEAQIQVIDPAERRNPEIPDIYEHKDGMRFFDYDKVHEMYLPTIPAKAGTRELMIGGRLDLGCTAKRYRIFNIFDCRAPTETNKWPTVDMWNAKTKCDEKCYLLAWNLLVFDSRDVFSLIVKLTFESRTEALKVKDDYPIKVLVEPMVGHYGDDEKITVCFSDQSVARNSVDAGCLLINEPTQAERTRVADLQGHVKVAGACENEKNEGGTVELLAREDLSVVASRPHVDIATRVFALGGQQYLLPEILRLGERTMDLEGLRKIAKDAGAHVLVQGETGTGKESLVLVMFEMAGVAPDKSVRQDCSALAPDIAESELFGHEKGAFTGADRKREGLLKQCDGGAIFLDEFGKLDNGLQQKLLRFMQEGEIRPAGANHVQKLHVRVFAGTNVDVKTAIAADLIARFSYKIELPPLRERLRDIFWMLGESTFLGGGPYTGITLRALCCLFSYAWPENIRGLGNLCREWKNLGTGFAPCGGHIADAASFKGENATAWAAFANYALAAWEAGDAARGWESDAAAVAMAGLLLAIVDGGGLDAAEPPTLALDGLAGWMEAKSLRFATDTLRVVLGAKNRQFGTVVGVGDRSPGDAGCDLGDALSHLSGMLEKYETLKADEREEPVASQAKFSSLRRRPTQPGRIFVEKVRNMTKHVPLWTMPEPPPGESELERLLDAHGIHGQKRKICLLCGQGVSAREMERLDLCSSTHATEVLADIRNEHEDLKPLLKRPRGGRPRKTDRKN